MAKKKKQKKKPQKTKNIDHANKDFMNIQNSDGYQCFKWCLFKYLNSADHYPARITKVDRQFEWKLDLKDIKNFHQN